MTIFFRKKDLPPHRPVISIVFLSVIFGFAAGAVGMLIIAAYVTPQPLLLSTVGLPLPREREAAAVPPVREIERVATPVEIAARSLVLFYPSDSGVRDLIGGQEVFLPAEAVGAGMVLTSDGWLVSHAGIFSGHGIKSDADLSAVIGSKRYKLHETVRDPFSGAVFIKIDGSNLPVVSFGDGMDLAPGDSVFAFDAARGPRRFDVIGFDVRPPQSPADLVRSSESLQKVLRLTPDADVLTGSMLLDRQGEVVGIYAGDGTVGSYAVPFRAFSGVIGSVLRDKTVKRPYFGVNYLDLTGYQFGAVKGALLTNASAGRRPAVIKHSPAAKAGLREGDIIVAVNGESVSVNNALSDMLAEYGPDSMIMLTFERDGNEMTAEAALATAPSP